MQKSAIKPAVHLPTNAAFEHLFFAAMGPCAPTMLNFTMKEGLINTEVVLQCGDCLDKGHGCADNQNRENHELCSDEGAHDECSGGVADQCSYRAVVLCSNGDLQTFAREHIMTQNLAIDQGRRHFLQDSLESGSSGPVAGIWHFFRGAHHAAAKLSFNAATGAAVQCNHWASDQCRGCGCGRRRGGATDLSATELRIVAAVASVVQSSGARAVHARWR